jgi:hypothetical protein
MYVYNIKLNPKHKVDDFYQHKDQIVSVFLPSKYSPFVQPVRTETKVLEDIKDSFQVRLFGYNEAKEDAYLINVNKKNICV